MDGFHYYNLFETKGMEYILTIIFFLTLIPFWILLNRKVKRAKQHGSGKISDRELSMPRGVYHSPNHSWMYLLKSGKARIGLSDLLLKITGNIEVRPLIEEGQTIAKGDPMIEISQGEKKIVISSPLTGHVLNLGYETSAEMLADPYGKGWLAEIEPSAWIAETSMYYLADDARRWASFEIVRFRDFLVNSLAKHEPQLQPVALQDGGELKEHIMQELPAEVWNDFQTEFLPQSDQL